MCNSKRSSKTPRPVCARAIKYRLCYVPLFCCGFGHEKFWARRLCNEKKLFFQFSVDRVMGRNYFFAFGRTSLVQVMRTFFSVLLPTSEAHANNFYRILTQLRYTVKLKVQSVFFENNSLNILLSY